MILYNNGDYPRYVGDLELQHPDWKRGDPLPEGWREVADTPMPKRGEGQIIREAPLEEIDGVLTRQWEVVDLTPEEIKARDKSIQVAQAVGALGLTREEAIELLGGN